MMNSRGTVMTAMFTALQAVASFQTTGRRIVLPRNMSDVAKPAMFMIEDDEDYSYNGTLQKVTLKADAWIYTASGLDPNATPSTELDTILDALDAALKPPGNEPFFTLGGLVYYARIEGRVFKDPGDLTGLGLAIVPIAILAP
jgi:hypothetical protein